MTRKKYTECDICEEKIDKMNHLRFRRWLNGMWVRLYEWGLKDMAPVDSGWRKWRIDVCEECYKELCTEIAERVQE